MKALYITRKYPPSIGGMQKMNYHLINELDRKIELDKIAWGCSQILLPVFILKAFLQVVFYIFIQKKDFDCICIGDAMLSPLGLFFRKIMHVPVVCIVHGLDITFNFPFYKEIIVKNLNNLDLIICVSQYTKSECMARGIRESTIKVIPNGVSLDFVKPNREEFLRRLRNEKIYISENVKILLTVGRLIKRKGVAEFIEKVFIRLKEEYKNVVYLIIGSGKHKKKIEHMIEKYQLGDCVFLLGEVDEKMLHYAYAVSDIFIMPNIKVKGNVEGFGIVALEASSYGVPIVASGLEGIKDAVRNNENGFLIPPDRPEVYKERILSLLQNDRLRLELSKKAKEYVKRFSWTEIADKYIDAFKETLSIQRKKILMVSRAVEFPWDEASRNLVRDITDILSQYQFSVLTTDNTKNDRENIAYERIYRGRQNTLSQKLRLLFYLLKKRTSFDLYHFCFTPEPLTSFLIRILISKNKKIWSIPYISPRMSNKRIKKLADHTSVITVTSEFSKDIFEKEDVHNVEVIYPGVDLGRFKPVDKSEKLGGTGKFIVLYSGDLTTDVTANTIESIIKETVLRTTNVDFIIASRIKKRDDVKRKEGLKGGFNKTGLQGRIRFMDSIENMPSLIADCDLVVYPYFEGFEKKIDIPYIIVEAMACGKPIVISDKRPLNEVMKDGAGMAINNDSSYEFAEAIISLYRNRELANDLGKRNRKVAERYFNINESIKGFASIYNKRLYN